MEDEYFRTTKKTHDLRLDLNSKRLLGLTKTGLTKNSLILYIFPIYFKTFVLFV
jgi:hypothetical protein